MAGFRKGEQVRVGFEPATFVRLGYSGAPTSRVWATVRRPDGTEFAAHVSGLYRETPEWQAWHDAYQRWSKVLRGVECPTCHRVGYHPPEFTEELKQQLDRELSIAHRRAQRLNPYWGRIAALRPSKLVDRMVGLPEEEAGW